MSILPLAASFAGTIMLFNPYPVLSIYNIEFLTLALAEW